MNTRMKWAVGGIGGLAALMAGAAMVGALLPRDHVAASTIALRQSPDSVWTAT